MSGELPRAVGAQFQAKFDGKCEECGESVEAGDLMGYVDDTAVCDGCYNDADQENWAAVRAAGEAMRAREQAENPEAYARTQAAVAKWRDSVLASAATNPGKDWVPSPGDSPGWVKVPPEDHEPPVEQEAPVGVEPGIQALMAAGLLQGQEPGGTGVCNAEIIDASGKVTEVAIPVPVDPPTAKAPRKRASRAKAKPEEVPSASSAEDAAAAALARAREGVAADKAEDARLMADIEASAVARMARLEEALAPNPSGPTKSGAVVPEAIAAGTPEFQELMGDLSAQGAQTAARLAQLAENSKDWDPAVIAAEVNPPAPVVDPLQAGLRAALESGAMTFDQVLALGYTGGPPAALQMAQDAEAMAETAVQDARRTREAIQDFKANYDNPAADIFIDALAAAKSVPEEDAILASLDNLAPYEGMPGGVEEAKKSILAVIEDAITNHPRSLQKTIGPSEIGTECDHCLAAKLAGWDQVREGGAWLPTVGTAVHTWLEECAFRRVMLDAFGRPRYLMERKVSVGTIGGVEITGSTDLVDLVRGMTWDWKIVGATTLKSAKVAPSPRYVVQQMLYARGWRRLGVLITHVGIAYLPRNDISLRKAVLWTAPYDEALAVEALERADRIHANLKAMESISVATRDQYVTGLDRWRSWRENVGGVERLVYGNAQEGKIECLDCARYADYPEDPAQAMSQLDGLL